MSASPDSRELIQQAASWYARLRGGPLTEADEARLLRWLESEPAHRAELEKMARLWDRLDAVAHSHEILAIRAQLARDTLVHEPRAEPPREPFNEVPRERVSRRAALGWALAAGVAGGGVYFGLPYLVKPESITTGIGEFRTVSLSDGSTVTLNTATEISVRFSKRTRRIELVRGQANFEVAKDSARPFIVHSGGGEIFAVGTVFDVYQRARGVVVTLIEGRVGVKVDAETLVLSPGEQATFAAGQPTARSMADVHLVTAWRSGKLEFRDTPLVEAIAEANRYSRVRIELHDPSFAQARISGVFDAGRNDALANALHAYFGLIVQRVGEDRILLLADPR